MRVLLIVVDGMRPDAIADLPPVKVFLKRSSYTMNASTVMPSVTLPCHMSLFHSVDSSRHGTTTNTYAPQVRPINGLCEVLALNNKKCAFFYSWEELRDISRPSSLCFSYLCRGKILGYDVANNILTDCAMKHINENYIDFSFLYLGYPDEAGHKYGWMSDEYMEALDNSWENIERIVQSLPDDYTVFITADHGGHDRIHGTDLPEDMRIPIIICGKDFEAEKELLNANIKDIAPTITKLLGVAADEDWEGKAFI